MNALRKKPEKETLAKKLKSSGLTLAVAESCTGGLIGHTITNRPGCSAYFMGGVIAYDNEVKKKLLGVKAVTLKSFGAVSEETAEEMARGVRKRLKADIGVAVTGIAGPSDGKTRKPVGLVFIGLSKRGRVSVIKKRFKGTRLAIKKAAAKAALKAAQDFI